MKIHIVRSHAVAGEFVLDARHCLQVTRGITARLGAVGESFAGREELL